MPTARKFDLNGYFEVGANPLSRAGVFPYTKRSIGFPNWEADPGGIVNVYRPPEELDNPETLASARLQPWVDDHTMLGDPANESGLTPAEKKGVHGTIGEQVFYDPTQRTMFANLKLWSPSLNDAIEAGKKELSMGFRCVYEFQSGEFEGQRYDAIQRKIRFNHLALVDQGRMGPSVAVLDHARFAFDAHDLREIKPMKTTKRIATAKKLGVAVDALPAYFGLDAMDAAALAKWNATMDAAEDDGEAEPAKGEMTLSEAAETISEMAEPLAELNGALAALAAPAASVGEPSDMPAAETDEFEMDAAGQKVIDPATGLPKKKIPAAAPAAPTADAVPPALAAADSALKVMKAASKKYHTALDGKTVPASLVAFDSAIVKGETAVRTIKAKARSRPGAALDAALVRISHLEQRVPAMDTKPALTVKDAMAAIAARDALYARVSPAIGAFDHAKMDETEIAVYACDKLDLTPAKGSELATLNGYLHNRPIEAPRSASAFALDGAVKSSSGASDYINGKPSKAA